MCVRGRFFLEVSSATFLPHISNSAMGPVPVQAGAFSGRAYPWQSVGGPDRRHIHASVKQRAPMGGQVDTGTKSKTDPKDLLQDLKRLREQRARLRAALTSQEQKVLAGQVHSAQPGQNSIDSDADPGNKLGKASHEFSPDNTTQCTSLCQAARCCLPTDWARKGR